MPGGGQLRHSPVSTISSWGAGLSSYFCNSKAIIQIQTQRTPHCPHPQVRFGVLNAGNYGVPQSRKRTIIWAAAPGEVWGATGVFCVDLCGFGGPRRGGVSSAFLVEEAHPPQRCPLLRVRTSL